MSGQWSVAVDRAVCIGSGMCAGSTPGYFGLDGGRAAAHEATVSPDEDVLLAAENCPVGAILVLEVGTGALLAPEE